MKLYTLPNCPKCKMLKKMLDDRRVAYETTEDVSPLTDAGYSTVPMLQLSEKFDESQLLDFAAAIKHVKSL